VSGARYADSGAAHDFGVRVRGEQGERRPVERGAVVIAGDRERLAEPTGPGTEKTVVFLPAALPHELEAVHRLEGTK
jgi:hypothetical protein